MNGIHAEVGASLFQRSIVTTNLGRELCIELTVDPVLVLCRALRKCRHQS